jgi:hypothetical protein
MNSSSLLLYLWILKRSADILRPFQLTTFGQWRDRWILCDLPSSVTSGYQRRLWISCGLCPLRQMPSCWRPLACICVFFFTETIRSADIQPHGGPRGRGETMKRRHIEEPGKKIPPWELFPTCFLLGNAGGWTGTQYTFCCIGTQVRYHG